MPSPLPERIHPNMRLPFVLAPAVAEKEGLLSGDTVFIQRVQLAATPKSPNENAVSSDARELRLAVDTRTGYVFLDGDIDGSYRFSFLSKVAHPFSQYDVREWVLLSLGIDPLSKDIPPYKTLCRLARRERDLPRPHPGIQQLTGLADLPATELANRMMVLANAIRAVNEFGGDEQAIFRADAANDPRFLTIKEVTGQSGLIPGDLDEDRSDEISNDLLLELQATQFALLNSLLPFVPEPIRRLAEESIHDYVAQWSQYGLVTFAATEKLRAQFENVLVIAEGWDTGADRSPSSPEGLESGAGL